MTDDLAMDAVEAYAADGSAAIGTADGAAVGGGVQVRAVAVDLCSTTESPEAPMTFTTPTAAHTHRKTTTHSSTPGAFFLADGVVMAIRLALVEWWFHYSADGAEGQIRISPSKSHP